MPLVGSSGGLVMPTVSIQIALSGSYWSPSNWVEINKYVRSFGTSRGRQHELQRVQAGTLELQLWNQDGRFSTWNTNSPYAYGGSAGSANGLGPGTPVKVTATWGATTYPVFYGFVDSWIPTNGQVLSTQVVKATDALAVLAQTPIISSSYSGQVLADGPILYWRLNDPLGSVSAADSSAGFATSGTTMIWDDPTYGFWDTYDWGSSGASGTVVGNVTFGQAGGLAKDWSPSASFTSVFASVQGTLPRVPTTFSVEFAVRCSTPGSGTQALVTVDGLMVGVDRATGHVDVVTGYGATTTDAGGSLYGNIWHHVAVTYNNSTGATVVYVDSVATYTGTLATGQLSGGLVTLGGAVAGGDTFYLQEVAFYPTTLSAGQVTTDFNLFLLGFATQQSGQMIEAMLLANGVPSSALGTIATGISQLQAPSVSLGQSQLLSTIQLAENSEQGFFYVDESGLIQFQDRHYALLSTAAVVSNGIFASDSDPSHYHFPSTTLVLGSDAVDLKNLVPVERAGGVLQIPYDAGSIGRYGRRALTGYTALMSSTDADANNLGYYLLSRYSTPLTRVRQITVDSVADRGTNFAQMLGRKLRDRITVNWQPLDGSNSPMVQDSLIEKITHKVTPEKWETTWGLSPAEAVDQFMVWDDPNLGFWDSKSWAF